MKLAWVFIPRLAALGLSLTHHAALCEAAPAGKCNAPVVMFFLFSRSSRGAAQPYVRALQWKIV
jgi:hypothetical protein